ncbi:MAG TPA: nuclear transport factor 2 family protein [Puia sp.]|nr:nuclear transport factor 2 family protein [Puia sp.]
MKKASLYLLLFLTACVSYVHRQQEVQDAMQHYDRLVQKMDADSIALLYTADGDLGGIAHGRDSIRRFLSSFKNVSLLRVASSTDSLAMTGDTAFQSGHYEQSGLMNGKDTFFATGIYHAKWIWIKGEGGWHIRKMTTRAENLRYGQRTHP